MAEIELIERPLDIYGNHVELGPWYWAKRGAKILGVGRFLATIGTGTIFFYLYETGYSPDKMQFVKVDPPNFLPFNGGEVYT